MMTLLVATNGKGGIGVNGTLPWRCSSDMEHFRKTTIGNIVVMGRKTFESLGNIGLPNRVNWVLSSNLELEVKGGDVKILPDKEVLFNELIKNAGEKIFLIGGGELYRSCISLCKEAIVSIIDSEEQCDTFFHVGDLIDNGFIVDDSYDNPIVGRDDDALLDIVRYVRKN